MTQQMRKWKSRWGYKGAGRIDEVVEFGGTAVVYAATTDDHTCFQCDFELEPWLESHPEQTRARRIQARGRPSALIPANRLKHEIVVLLGPELSASDAVRTLKRLAKQIERDGLLVGRGTDDDFVTEKIDGSLV
jgi:hypothetical protein